MTTQEIAEFVSGILIGDGSVEVTGAASLKNARTGDLAFIDTGRTEIETEASCVLVPSDFEEPPQIPVIKVRDPKLSFARIVQRLLPTPERSGPPHPTADVDLTSQIDGVSVGAMAAIGPDTTIGSGSQVHEGVRIGTGVSIGESTVLYPNVVVYDNARIGSNCVIHSGAVIGAPGFGYVKDENGEYLQFPQIGTVVIEDNVEIGANTCIDRGALGDTRIGRGTKIDNLVQIAHNVEIGKNVVIAAQTGISGSTVIEDNCVIGGQVGMGDHARVLSGAVIGSQAGVLPGKIVREGVWWGTPVQPLEAFKKQNALVKSLPRLKEELKEMRRDIDRLKDGGSS